jgi:energy-coupling factor transport system permease protein
MYQSRTPNQPPLHSLVWLVWLGAGVAAVSSNPLLNILVLAQAILVAITCHTDSPVGRAWSVFVRLGAVLLALRIIFSAIPVGGFSYGTTALFTIPVLELPVWLGGLKLGGVATLEMIVQGVVDGLRLWTLLLVFGAFNACADHYKLLRRTPRALFHAGLIVTIALTFVPQVIIQLAAIRDAQRVRGHRFRTWRDSLPLLVPLLAGGLERSIQLAEAMDSRGYGRTTTPRRGAPLAQLVIIGGVTLLGLGAYLQVAYSDLRGGIVATAGVILSTGALRWLSNAGPRTRYAPERWHRRDTLATIASGALIIGMVLCKQLRLGGLLYTPLPTISLPLFDPLVGVLLLLLSVPAVIGLLRDPRRAARTPAITTQRRAWLRSSRRSEQH